MSELHSQSSISTPSPPLYPPPTALQRLKSLLRQTLRLTTSDGRIFLGTFVGTDKQLNVLLVSTEEFRVGSGAKEWDMPIYKHSESRFVGQVMVPWRLVKKVEVQQGGQAAAGGEESREVDSDDDSLYS